MLTRLRKDFFLQSVALLRAGHNPCQRHEIIVSTNNGLVNGRYKLLLQLFHPGQLKNGSFRTLFL